MTFAVVWSRLPAPATGRPGPNRVISRRPPLAHHSARPLNLTLNAWKPGRPGSHPCQSFTGRDLGRHVPSRCRRSRVMLGALPKRRYRPGRGQWWMAARNASHARIAGSSSPKVAMITNGGCRCFGGDFSFSAEGAGIAQTVRASGPHSITRRPRAKRREAGSALHDRQPKGYAPFGRASRHCSCRNPRLQSSGAGRSAASIVSSSAILAISRNASAEPRPQASASRVRSSRSSSAASDRMVGPHSAIMRLRHCGFFQEMEACSEVARCSLPPHEDGCLVQ